MSKSDLRALGYASKLFNDGEAAAQIDSASHLHPHELDLLATIDRFDVRGLLEFPIDFKRATEKRDGDGVPLDEIEMLRSDRFGDLDAQLDHDDEYRKLQEEIAAEESQENEPNDEANGKYGAVGFSYDETGGDKNLTEEKEAEPTGKLFIVPQGLKLPKNMPLPKFDTEHEIIVKTAGFLAHQNIQMEILLKAKQSNNEKFSFLNFGHQLNDYYKHVKKLIAKGEFNPAEQDPVSTDSDSDSDDGGGLSALNAAAARAVSKKQTPTAEEQRPASPNVANIDENHPLFKIISKRKEAERIALLERENQERQKEIKKKFANMVQVPPPDICQTVDWVAKELVATDLSERDEKEHRLRMQATLEFMNKGHHFYNYYQTILQRTLLTSMRRSSPPPPPNPEELVRDATAEPIKFEITKPTGTTTGPEFRIEEARKKAQEVAKAIVNRELQNRLAKKAKEMLKDQNAILKESENEKRLAHKDLTDIENTIYLAKQGVVPPPPSDLHPRKEGRRRRSRSRSRSKSTKTSYNGRDRKRSRSRSYERRKSKSRSRSRERYRHRRRKTRKHRRSSRSLSRSRSQSK